MTQKQANRSSRRSAAAVLPAVREVVTRVTDEQGLLLWDLSLGREAGRDVVRVFVDRPEGVTAQQIGDATHAISRGLDEADTVTGESAWVLEVSTPGAERILRDADDFRFCKGRDAKVTLTDGTSRTGVINNADDAGVELDTETIAWTDIVRAQLVIGGK